MQRRETPHNVEESGETEKFVPRLYAHAQGD